MRIEVRFPLGVYHAQSQSSSFEPEWPPHPVRLIGALVSAAHSSGRPDRSGKCLKEDLALLQRLCDASPPLIGAAEAVPIGKGARDEVALVTGATRWAPRNYFTKGGREQAQVQKVGVAVGDKPIHFAWPGLDLGSAGVEQLSSLASDVSFLGTTRSPVVAEVAVDPSGDLGPGPVWTPLKANDAQGARSVAVRVPDTTTLDAFDRRHKARQSSKTGVEAATAAVPGIRIGREVAYVHSSALDRPERAIDPHWWGDMFVLAIDRVRSEVIPRSGASYLLARAVRMALLSAYESVGGAGDAPAILRGRGDEAHCAIVPLADVWHEGSRGHIKGVAIMLPSDQRTDGLPHQRVAIEQGLGSLVGDTDGCPQRYIQIPGSGRIWLRLPNPGEAALKTLLKRTYRTTATSWLSVTPVVHARWRKGPQETLMDQVTRDCSHVGLPIPAQVEPMRGSGFPGAANRPVPTDRVPTAWRKSLGGPSSHLRLTFRSPVVGPVLLGRARHFGLGLFVPELGAPNSAGRQ